ncbi:MAG: FAD-dependent oxidoreductase [Nitrospiraceae bacterium]
MELGGSFDVVVVGGGIIGLATAMCVMQSRPGTRLAVLEKESDLARHQTGHNSGVIHSGLYYKPGSLKARNCRKGYALLLEFCRAENIPYEICGKVVVATSAGEIPRIEELHRRGIANGLQGLRRLGPAEIREIEPHCTGVNALLVPETGIIDYCVLDLDHCQGNLSV